MYFLLRYATGHHIEPFIVDEIIFKGGKVFLMGTHGEGKFPSEKCYLTHEEAESASRGGAE